MHRERRDELGQAALRGVSAAYEVYAAAFSAVLAPELGNAELEAEADEHTEAHYQAVMRAFIEFGLSSPQRLEQVSRVSRSLSLAADAALARLAAERN